MLWMDETTNTNINIVNLHNVNIQNLLLEEKDNVYIGRGSKWGNPSKKTVKKSLKNYLKQDKDLAKSASQLKGKILGCFCSPEPCHGEILHRLAGNIPVYQPKVKNSVSSMGPKNFVVSKQMHDALVEKTKLLENRVNVLEDKNTVLESVNSNLQREHDQLDQYGRRSNIIETLR